MGKYALVAYTSYASVFLALQLIIGHHRGAVNPASRTDTRARVFLIPLVFGVIPWIFVIMWHQQVRYVPMVIGGVIVAAGLALSMWAMWIVGPNWVGGIGVHKYHRIVQNGPYRYIRHPFYSGMLLSALGFGIFGWNVWFLLSALAFSGSFAFQARAEERTLQDKPKLHYADYAARTGMFWPRVRRTRPRKRS